MIFDSCCGHVATTTTRTAKKPIQSSPSTTTTTALSHPSSFTTTTFSSPQQTEAFGTRVNYVQCDPGTIFNICLTQKTWGMCLQDGAVINMGIMHLGTSCTYSFAGGIARSLPVKDGPVNFRNYQLNNYVWWQEPIRGAFLQVTLRPGKTCGAARPVLCTGPDSALVCTKEEKAWKEVSCTLCVEQNSTELFQSDICKTA
ncbi:hypothetical protein BJ742DRAFT_792234 [Cladochytrium replicatum]|nr:hypothetical protein BJ742DRAFT_792234 [Cladochytrium replicatum]